jgi:hypothetical protein
MGFFPKAAKFAANAEIWAGDPDLVAQYQAQEASVRARAKEVGASTTIIRAGTLKGGASGDALMGGAGEPMFLNPAFYTIGQQDVVCARHGARHASPAWATHSAVMSAVTTVSPRRARALYTPRMPHHD